MQQLKERILSLLDREEQRFVFPSEISARFWRHAIVADDGPNAVWGDRFISWDRFKERCFGLREERRPVNAAVRTLFAVHTAEAQRQDPFLERLLPAGGGGAAELVRILPRLATLMPQLGGKDWPIARDIDALHRRYRAFLDQHGLYEPSLLKPTLERLDTPYLLCFPELLEDYPAYRSDLTAHRLIELFPVPKNALGPINLYRNEKLEADALFARIRGLIDAGCGADQIIITLPSIEENRYPIEEAARRYDIPLVFRTGKALSEYASVRLFSLIDELVDSSFELDRMKNLLLNEALPWREKESFRVLIRHGIDAYVVRNWREGRITHGWEEQLAKAGRRESLELYRRLSSGLQQLTSSPSFADLASRMQAFSGSFLDTERWQSDEPLQLYAFQRALDVLKEFVRTEAEFPELITPSPYAVWIEALGGQNYVEQQQRGGIAVYPYRVSAGIDPAYHFIPFLTQDSAAVAWDRGYPLNEAQRAEAEISDEDATDAYLKVYLASGETVIASCADEGFRGPGLAPGLFVEAGLELRPEDEPGYRPPFDPERQDEEFFLGREVASPFVTKWQRAGFRRFAETGALPRGNDLLETALDHEGLTRSLVDRFLNREEKLGISATDLDAFIACPFAFLFERILGIREVEYRAVLRDYLKEGILLHSILEDFIAGLPEGRFQSARLEEYVEAIISIAEKLLTDEERRPLPIAPAWRASAEELLRFARRFPKGESEHFDGYAPVESEDDLTGTIAGVPAVGRIDRVSRGPAGEMLIVDYKRSFKLTRGDMDPDRGSPASLQLPFYRLLLEDRGRIGPDDELTTAYYSAAEGRYKVLSDDVDPKRRKPMLTDEKFRALISLTEEKLQSMAERLREGDYRSDPEECAGCPLRALCRSRYIVREERGE